MPYTARPNFRASHHACAAGHYLAAQAGFEILQEGGNAADAAACIAFCLVVLEPHQNGLGGECPTLVHFNGKTFSVSGQGFSPKSLTLDYFTSRGIRLIPGDGLLPATVPAHLGTWLLILREFGSLPLTRILEPAIDLAEHGFIVHESLSNEISHNQKRFTDEWTTSAETYLIDGEAPKVGQRLKLPVLADTLRSIRNASVTRPGRADGLQAAHDWFYRGPAAQAIERFCANTVSSDSSGQDNGGFLTLEDTASWRPKLLPPVSFDYKGVTVHKCGPWTQGPVFLQQLALLSQVDLKSLGYGTADYYHTLIESARLAFADREAWYGDPDVDQVPLDVLLSSQYNTLRAKLIDPAKAMDAAKPGDPFRSGEIPDITVAWVEGAASGPEGHLGDTTHLDVVDRFGNCISATPSGGWLMSSPVVPELGFALGTRGQMFYLDPSRNNCYAQRKRPRATLTPSLAFRDDKPWLVFGTPGGDGQDQWTLQAFLNVVEWGMDPASALEEPTFTAQSFPSSFFPRRSFDRRVACENRIPVPVLVELQQRGHEIEVDEAFSHGKPSLIRIHQDYIEAAITSRAEIGYVAGW